MARTRKRAAGAPPRKAGIAPGYYTRDTLPPLDPEAQALLDSIWDSAEQAKSGPAAAVTDDPPKSPLPRGRSRVSDQGPGSFIDHLTRR